MAYMQMPDGTREYIFGEGFADDAAAKLGTKVLARIPLDKTLHTQNISEQTTRIFDAIADEIVG